MKLIDGFGRPHSYLRISLTDSCNLRCRYCMPSENYRFMPHHRLMSAQEIYQLATIFTELGIEKIRLTGGEPLVRKDFAQIIELLGALPVQLTLTTNGILLKEYLPLLATYRVRSINISLDTLDRSKFRQLAQRDQFDKVWENIGLAVQKGFSVKINVVALRGCIEEELLEFVALTRTWPVHVRFIEFMPFTGNGWDRAKVITAEAMQKQVAEQFDIIKLTDEPHATARKFKVVGYEGTFAFITTMSHQFCGECNRLRLTADGKIKNCLFGKDELDLLSALRGGQNVSALIAKSVASKHYSMGGQFLQGSMHTDPTHIQNRSMITIGG